MDLSYFTGKRKNAVKDRTYFIELYFWGVIFCCRLDAEFIQYVVP